MLDNIRLNVFHFSMENPLNNNRKIVKIPYIPKDSQSINNIPIKNTPLNTNYPVQVPYSNQYPIQNNTSLLQNRRVYPNATINNNNSMPFNPNNNPQNNQFNQQVPPQNTLIKPVIPNNIQPKYQPSVQIKPQNKPDKTKPWSKQRGLKEQYREEGVGKVQDFVADIYNIEDLRTRTLIILLYLSAARLGEMVRYKRMKGGELIQIPHKKNKNKTYTKMINGKYVEYSGIKKKDINIVTKNERKVLLISLRNEKNKTRHRKEIPIPLDNDIYLKLSAMVKEYLDEIDEDDELFPIGYNGAYKLIKDFCNPHWLRHLRLTHLITVHDLNENLLKKVAGWTDTRPARNYAELSWKDILDKM